MKTQIVKHLQLGLAITGLLFAQSSRADVKVSSPAFNLPVHVNAIVDESGCLNNPGPTITMSGTLSLGSVNARVIFSNNQKGTHTAVVTSQYDVTLLAGGNIVLPKQPVQGGVGGNPHIYLQFHDGNGNDLSDEFYLGRCVQGLAVSADVLQAALVNAIIHAEGCSNNKGPFITFGGDLVLGGLHARFIFRNNLKGTHTAEDTRDVSIVLEGSKIVLPKQPPQGGAGGNPLISIQFLQGTTPVGAPVELGRCVKL
jgi:hypothetical protein